MMNERQKSNGRLRIMGRLICLASLPVLSGCIEAGILHPAGEVSARQRAHLITGCSR